MLYQKGGDRMTDWLFWLSLAGMLWTGHAAGVGFALRAFASAAGAVALLAALFPLDLERQLQSFLLFGALHLWAARRAAHKGSTAPGRSHLHPGR